MEEIVWIETLSRHREVATRQRCRGPVVRVGRAYDNDVVIDDPYVAAYHLRIARDGDGRLVAEDLGSLNGLFVDRDRTRRTQIVLEGDRPIRIGGTRWIPSLDVFNVFNTNTVQAIRGTQNASNANNIQAIVAPRVLRFGIRVNW